MPFEIPLFLRSFCRLCKISEFTDNGMNETRKEKISDGVQRNMSKSKSLSQKEMQAVRGLRKRKRSAASARDKKAAAALLKLKKSGPSSKEKKAASTLLKLKSGRRCTKSNTSAKCEANRCIQKNMKKNMSKARKENVPYNKAVAASLKISYKACSLKPAPRNKASKKGPTKRSAVTWRKRVTDR